MRLFPFPLSAGLQENLCFRLSLAKRQPVARQTETAADGIVDYVDGELQPCLFGLLAVDFVGCGTEIQKKCLGAAKA